MDMREPQYIMALADCQSITKAAKNLGISQPALSMFIANVENSLGVKLFERQNKKLIPTYAGEKYICKAQQMLRLHDELKWELEAVRTEYAGRIRIGFPVRRSPYLLPPLLKVFSHDYPGIQVIVDETHGNEREIALRKGELDFNLVNYSHPDPDFDYYPIKEDPILLVVPPSHPLQSKGIRRSRFSYPWIDLRLFSKEKFILNQPGQTMRRNSDLALQQAGFTPSDPILIRSTEATVRLAAEGLGITFTMASYARQIQTSARIGYFMIGDPILKSDLVVAYRKSMEIQPPAKYLLELIQKII